MVEAGGQKMKQLSRLTWRVALYGHEFRDETKLLAKETL